jgi:hypothetical protein
LGTADDAADNSSSRRWKYVDDLSLGEIRLVNGNSNSSMQSDVSDLYTWSQENHLKLNPSKCKSMQFCFKKSPPQAPSLLIGDNELEVVSETKLLGLWVQNDLKWDKQVKTMVSKGSHASAFIFWVV